MRVKLLLVSFLFGITSSLSADEESKEINDKNNSFGLSLSSGVSRQDFDEVDSTLKSILLQPYFFWSNGWASLDVPWYSIDGNYLIQTSRPTLSLVCKRMLSASPAVLQARIKSGKLTRDAVDACLSNSNSQNNVNYKSSGVGDLNASVNYLFALDDDAVWSLAAGVSYKLDNGDVDTGLGSGTKDLGIGFTLSAEKGRWHNNFILGYTNVSAGDLLYQNYGYGAVDIAVDTLNWLTLGATLSQQQASIVDGSSVKSFSFNVITKFSDELTFSLVLTNYLNTPDYPDREYGVVMSYSF